MKLTIFNGSPRINSSNTKILMDKFCNGYTAANEENKVETAYLAKIDKKDDFIEMFEEAEFVIMAFPLYCDSMPGIVKRFIEDLEPFIGREKNPPIGFVIQSGFPEIHHSRFVERYLQKFAKRMGCQYLGTVIRGNCEGLRLQTEKHTKLLDAFNALGAEFGKTGTLNHEIIQSISKPEKIPAFGMFMVRIMLALNLLNKYWDEMMKENHAYDERHAQPYIKSS